MGFITGSHNEITQLNETIHISNKFNRESKTCILSIVSKPLLSKLRCTLVNIQTFPNPNLKKISHLVKIHLS